MFKILKKTTCIIGLFIVIVFHSAFNEISPKRVNQYFVSQWDNDTIYIGAEVIVTDSTKDIIVSWKKAKSIYMGKLYVIKQSETEQFLFHNYPERIPGEPKTVDLGKYPAGTILTFRYSVDDTSASEWLNGKKLYSGQNRSSVDQFISERSTSSYGCRWAAAAQKETEKIWVGFSDHIPSSFESIIFEVQGGVSLNK